MKYDEQVKQTQNSLYHFYIKNGYSETQANQLKDLCMKLSVEITNGSIILNKGDRIVESNAFCAFLQYLTEQLYNAGHTTIEEVIGDFKEWVIKNINRKKEDKDEV